MFHVSFVTNVFNSTSLSVFKETSYKVARFKQVMTVLNLPKSCGRMKHGLHRDDQSITNVSQRRAVVES